MKNQKNFGDCCDLFTLFAIVTVVDENVSETFFHNWSSGELFSTKHFPGLKQWNGILFVIDNLFQ